MFEKSLLRIAPLWENDDEGGGGDSVAPVDPGVDKGSVPPGGGDNPAAWRNEYASMLEDDQDKETFQNYASRVTDKKSFLKSVTHMVRMQGQMVKLPGQDAKPEDLDGIYRKLGKPEKPSEYEFKHVPERGDLDESEKAAQESFGELAHRIHLTKAQLSEIVKWEDQLAVSSRKSQTESFTKAEGDFLHESENKLRTMWGAHEFDANMTHASRAWKMYAGDKSEELGNIRLANGGKLSDIPELVDIFARVGRERAADKSGLIQTDPASAESVREQIDTIKAEARSKGKLPSDPEYHKKLEPLYKRLYGGTPYNPGVSRFQPR